MSKVRLDSVNLYVARNGKAPLELWLESLGDSRARARIKIRIARLELGNFGDCRGLGGGLQELRIDCGPGYRVYFVQMKAGVVLLLRGGSKKTQKTDIEKAREYLSDYKDRHKETDSNPNKGIQKME